MINRAKFTEFLAKLNDIEMDAAELLRDASTDGDHEKAMRHTWKDLNNCLDRFRSVAQGTYSQPHGVIRWPCNNGSVGFGS